MGATSIGKGGSMTKEKLEIEIFLEGLKNLANLKHVELYTSNDEMIMYTEDHYIPARKLFEYIEHSEKTLSQIQNRIKSMKECLSKTIVKHKK